MRKHTIETIVTVSWTQYNMSDKVCQWLATGRWFSLGPPASSTNKTDHHDITVDSGGKYHNSPHENTAFFL